MIVLSYALLIIILWQLHHYSAQDYRSPGVGPDVEQQLAWLGQALRQGAGDSTQAWYPEGYFFMHAIYGSALINQARLKPDDAALRQRNIQEVAWVLDRLESDLGRAPFLMIEALFSLSSRIIPERRVSGYINQGKFLLPVRVRKGEKD